MVYAEIDKNSELLWGARNNTEFIRFGRSIGERTRKNAKEDEVPAWEKDTNATFGYGEITKGAFTSLLSYMQDFEKQIKDHCKEEGVDIKKLPFKPEEYVLQTRKSTFLDIGSGFGKPNFHAALQVFPKESIGVEVVEARVCYSIDQKYKFEEQYMGLKAKREKEQNSKSKISQVEDTINNDEVIKQLKKIAKEVDILESSLVDVSMIKGNLKTLQKIRHDINNKMAKLTSGNSNIVAS